MQGLMDMHCHILPGVDDGASGLEEAMWLLGKEYRDGVRTILLTPHFRYGMFEPTEEAVQKQFERLKAQAAVVFGDDLRLFLGCELHSSMDMIDLLKAGERRTMAGSRYVLVEFSGGDEKSYIKERIQKLKFAGFRPIIAHAERYKNLRNDSDLLWELHDFGALIQMNADTVNGTDGFSAKRLAKKWLKEGLVDMIGSDGHAKKHRVPELGKAYDKVAKLVGQSEADRLFIENPNKIIE